MHYPTWMGTLTPCRGQPGGFLNLQQHDLLKRPNLWERCGPSPGTSQKHLRRLVDIAIWQRKILWLQNCNYISKGNAVRKWRAVVGSQEEAVWSSLTLNKTWSLRVIAKLPHAHCREALRTLFQPKPSLHLHQFLKSTKGFKFPATYLQVPKSREASNGPTTSSPRILCFLAFSKEVHFSRKSPPSWSNIISKEG